MVDWNSAYIIDHGIDGDFNRWKIQHLIEDDFEKFYTIFFDKIDDYIFELENELDYSIEGSEREDALIDRVNFLFNKKEQGYAYTDKYRPSIEDLESIHVYTDEEARKKYRLWSE